MGTTNTSDGSLHRAMSERILILDGAMGTMIQRAGLSESDFRGGRWAASMRELKGCNDALVLSRSKVVKDVHRQYLDAGADIIETDSFNANAISLADYGLENDAYEINLAAARLAREAVAEWQQANSNEPRWVAGSAGPTNKSLSMSADIADPASRGISWDELTAAYLTQFRGLIDGGVDVLLIETVFDTLNAKAALWAAVEAMEATGRQVPLMLSVTLTESGRTLSGQTLEAFLAAVTHARFLTVGLNCGFGAEGMAPWVEQLAPLTASGVCVYPNAGLPNAMGEYDETPATMVAHLRHLLESGCVNVVGGCCGTTPAHIAAIAALARDFKPRVAPVIEPRLRLSGLEHLDVVPESNFINIGERCNVAGSRKFLRLISEKNYDEALAIAHRQVDAGAQIIDVNMDDGMLDARSEMSHFLRLLASDPDVARVPVMIDSSKWDVIVAGLECLQGKGIVNSISLKDGERTFRERAAFIRRMGAATVVMAFDEEGQASTLERRIAVCRRAYRILTEEVGFEPNDIIFDPNVLAVATGIEEHADYARDFIEAVGWIKTNLPGAKVSGGVSNLSFSFRGNNAVREAMHSVFLYHAIGRGMDMAIVNAAAMVPYEEVPAPLRSAIEDVLFNRDAGATDRLVQLAEAVKQDTTANAGVPSPVEADESLSPSERLLHMVVKGNTDGIDAVLSAAHTELKSALAVIDGPLMGAMNRVGELFGAGKLFLPQVVKSARTMKQAVEWLNPLIEAEKSSAKAQSAGRVVIATVKGDVHDIGKNIVTVILRCNGFEVIDLGVMVPAATIVERAIVEKADIVALSGLITPSLDEMCRVAGLMQQRHLSIPLMVGGATTSALHTAVKIAPRYDAPVVYTRDAAMMPVVALRLLTQRESFVKEWTARQQELRSGQALAAKPLFPLAEARRRRPALEYPVHVPLVQGAHTYRIALAEARKFINWRPFFTAWKFDASMASIAEVKGCDCRRAVWLARHDGEEITKSAQAMQLYKEANQALDYLEQVAAGSIVARVGIFPCRSADDTIFVKSTSGEVELPMLRQQAQDGGDTLVALSDFISPAGDYIGVFAVTAGEQVEAMTAYQRTKGDEYRALLFQTLADRLAEAATELIHKRVRCELWGYAHNEPANPENLLLKYYEGIRPAVGYPSMPDQSLIFELDRLIDIRSIGIQITENGAMKPAASTSGLMLAHPDSRYFMVGPIGYDQCADYARRRGITLEALSHLLPHN